VSFRNSLTVSDLLASVLESAGLASDGQHQVEFQIKLQAERQVELQVEFQVEHR